MAASWEHLLGGYATNTLTEEEKRQLFEAALQDQTLFDAMADEEAFKAMLDDPAARQRILASLQANEFSDAVATERGGWWRWFRQPSSLAWSGSIAALGLALIFGWQMGKEWGLVVYQEQEAAKSSSGDKVGYRAEKHPEEGSGAVSKDVLEERVNQAVDKNVEPQFTPEPAARVETDNVDRLGQIPVVTKQESDGKEIGQAMRRQQANEQVTHASPSPSASSQSKVERSVQSLAVPQTPEVPLPDITPQAAAPGRFADRAVQEFDQSYPGAQELFYASSGFLADEVIAEKNEKGRMDQRSDQALRGALSKELNPSSKKKALSFPLEREVAGDSAISTARGIRYSFVQHTKKGKDEEVEARKITGNWSQVRLALETNVSGYFYVLAPMGNGKWQNLLPIESDKTGQAEPGIKVKSFQRVEFLLSQLTNALGKPVVPSVSVLLSPGPLDDLGQWVRSEGEMSEFKMERADGAVFVVQPTLIEENPLQVRIPLVEQ